MLDRSQFIGGSDCAVIMGLSPYKTPYDLWIEKTTGATDSVTERNVKVLQRGKRLEPVVLEMLQDETNINVIARNQRYTLKDKPYISCEIDFEWLDQNEEMQTGEIKTANLFLAKNWGEEYTSEIPDYYHLQAMHGLMITGRKCCLFGTLIGTDDLRIYVVERDEEIIERILEEEVKFWNLVETKTPPLPNTLEDFSKIFKKDNGKSIVANDDLVSHIHSLQLIKKQMKDLEKNSEKIEMKIKEEMKDSSMIVDHAGRRLASWTNQVTNRFDQSQFRNEHSELFDKYKKASESRVFRISN